VFFEYLIEQKLISKKQLMNAVITQLESMPSLLRVIIDDELLSEDKIFEVMLRSNKENLGLYDGLKNYGGLTDDDLSKALARQNTAASSLGNILVEQESLSKEAFSDCLRNYSALTPQQKEIKLEEEDLDQASVEADEKKSPQSEVAINSAALESLMEIGGYDESTLKELEGKLDSSASDPDQNAEAIGDETESDISSFLSFYDDDKQSELYVASNRYRLKGREKDLALLLEGMSSLQAVIKEHNLRFMAKLLTPCVEYLSYLMKHSEEGAAEWRALPTEVLEVLWEFRENIFAEMGEEALLKDSESKERYLATIKNIMKFIKR